MRKINPIEKIRKHFLPIAISLSIFGMLAVIMNGLLNIAEIPTSPDIVISRINPALHTRTKEYGYNDMQIGVMIRQVDLMNLTQRQQELAGVQKSNQNYIISDEKEYQYQNNSNTATTIILDVENMNDQSQENPSVLLKNKDVYVRDTLGNVYQSKAPYAFLYPNKADWDIIDQQAGFDYALKLYFDLPDDAVIKDLVIKKPKDGLLEILPINFNQTNHNASQRDNVYKEGMTNLFFDILIYAVILSIIFTIYFYHKKQENLES